MNALGRTIRVVTLVAVALAIGLVWSTGAMAQDGTATVTVHKAECPTGVGSAIFEDCHSNGLGGVQFAIGPDGGASYYTTDGDGVIGPVTVPSDTTIVIAENPDTLSQYLGAYVYCSDQTTGTVVYDSDLDGAIGVTGSFPAGAEIICDWYDITPAAAAPVATTTTSTTTTTLPATGTGMAGTGTSPLALLALFSSGLLLLAGMTLRK